MELVKTQIQMERKKGAASTQATFDEVYNLPDYLPDLFSVILTSQDVRLDEIKSGTGHMLVRGVIRFRVLYRTDQNDWKISSLEGEIPFQETLVMDQMDEFDMAVVEPVLEDLSVRINNSRKLNIRALLELKASVEERYDAELPVSLEADRQPEIMTEEREFLELRYHGNEQCHIREEVQIPSNKPNVGQILWQQAQIFGMETRITPGEVTVQGEIQVFLVYAGEESGGLQWFAESVPYQCVFEIPEADSSQIPYVTVRAQSLNCSLGSDEDGEPRVILTEADLRADICLYGERKQELISDTYALDCSLILEKEKVPLMGLRMKNESRCRVNETMKIQNPDQDILQICAGFGTADIDHQEITEEGILVEGAVRVQLLYLTSSDQAPLEAMEEVIPFRYTIEIPGITAGDQVELQHSLDTLSFLMKNSREVELQAVIGMQVLVTNPFQMEVIREIRREDLKIEELNTQPSIVGLTLTQEDSLWKIAKKYHTTIERIKKTNRLESDNITQGMKILLIKQLPQRI